MVTLYESPRSTWIDIEKPSREELAGLQEKYGIHPVVLSELMEPSLRAKVDLYPQYAYMILRFPAITNGGNLHSAEEIEIDFVIGRDFIITAHYVPVEPLYALGKFLESGAILERENRIEHAGFLFYAMIRRLYQSTEDDLIHLHNHIKKVEGAIFAGEERRMVEEISRLNRVLINFWWSTRAHEQILSSFTMVAKNFWGDSFNYYVDSLSGEFTKIERMIKGYKEVVSGLHDTNNSLLTTKTNETMKILSMVAAIMFPISTVAVIFAMNVDTMPFVDSPYSFWIINACFAVFAISAVGYFKFKRWI